MTDETMITLAGIVVAAIPSTIMAYGAMKAGRRNEIKTDENTVITKATAEKVNAVVETGDALVGKTDIIEKQTNHHLDAIHAVSEALRGELAAAREDDKRTQKEMEALKVQVATLIAQRTT